MELALKFFSFLGRLKGIWDGILSWEWWFLSIKVFGSRSEISDEKGRRKKRKAAESQSFLIVTWMGGEKCEELEGFDGGGMESAGDSDHRLVLDLL